MKKAMVLCAGVMIYNCIIFAADCKTSENDILQILNLGDSIYDFKIRWDDSNMRKTHVVDGFDMQRCGIITKTNKYISVEKLKRMAFCPGSRNIDFTKKYIGMPTETEFFEKQKERAGTPLGQYLNGDVLINTGSKWRRIKDVRPVETLCK